MNAKAHYDNHLARFYSWMAGDFLIRQKEAREFLERQNIFSGKNKIAIDLGAEIR